MATSHGRPARPEAILFITATRIGDCVMSLGLLDHLVRSRPGARVTIAAGAPSCSLFAAVPGLERIIPVVKRDSNIHWLELYRAVVAKRWDLAVDLRGSALAWGLRARRRIIVAKGRGEHHRVEQLGAALGLDPPPAPRLWLTAAHERSADGLVGGTGPFLALAPAAGWGAKEWPVERFAELAVRLTAPGAALAGARIAVLAGRGDDGVAGRLMALLPPSRRLAVLGEPDLLTVGAVLARAALFVGNDSGLSHMAAASGAPTLALFGPTPASLYRPWGPHAAFVQTDIPYRALIAAPDFVRHGATSLMGSLSVDKVLAAAAALLAGTAGTRLAQEA